MGKVMFVSSGSVSNTTSSVTVCMLGPLTVVTALLFATMTLPMTVSTPGISTTGA